MTNRKRSGSWVPFDPTYRGDVKPAPGCYVLFLGRVPIYIGQSENVLRRMVQHGFENVPGRKDMTKGHVRSPWGELQWEHGKFAGKVKYAVRYGEHLMLEARLIRRLQPQFNRRGLTNG